MNLLDDDTLTAFMSTRSGNSTNGTQRQAQD
jgi:hypothetical protein